MQLLCRSYFKQCFPNTEINNFRKRKLSLRSSQHKSLMRNLNIIKEYPNRPFLLRQRNDGYHRVYSQKNNILIIKKIKTTGYF